MTNGRNTRGIWQRDWSAVASSRAARWTRHVTPALGGVARRAARPTLRLFGAGRKPGPAMATVLPRQEPLVLRTKRPERALGTPLLTVQREVALDLNEAAQQPATEPQGAAGPGPTAASTAPVLRQTEPSPTLAAPPARAEPASVVGRISRAVQQVLRRPAPTASPPAPGPSEPAARTEAATRTSQPGAAQPGSDSPASQASVVAAPQPVIAPTAAEAEEEVTDRATPPAFTFRQQAESPAGPSYIESSDEAETTVETAAGAEVEAQPPVLQRSATPDAGHGLLMSLRRVFRPAQSAEDETPLEAPVESRAVPAIPAETPRPADVSPAAPSLAREAPPGLDEPPATTPAGPVAEVAATETRLPTPLPGAIAPAEAPVLPRSTGEERPQAGGLLFTLRRLVRQQPEPESAQVVERVAEAPATRAPQEAAAEPAPRVASTEVTAPSGQPLVSREERALPALEASMEAEAEPAEGEMAPPALRATDAPEMALRRSRGAPDATERFDTASFDEAEAAMAPEPPEAPAAPEVALSRVAEGGSRLPRILRLWHRPVQAPQDDLNLTLARPVPAAPASAAVAPVQRSTYNVETGRTELLEETAEVVNAPENAPPMPGVARAGAAGEAEAAVLRRTPRTSLSRQISQPSPAAGRGEAPLIYRTRQAETAPPALGAMAPGSMATLEVSPAAVAQIRRATMQTNSTVIARAEAEAAPPSAPGEGAGEAPPPGGGPAATPIAVEGEKETQITLETLARKVYDKLRARLVVERERAGIGAGIVGR